ncbi:MAG: hypothetical protein ABIO99_06565, partial [Candidatus Limnocylindria bacterium]
MPPPDRDAVHARTPGRGAVRALAVGLFVVIVAMVVYSVASVVVPGTELMPNHPSLFDLLVFSPIVIAFPTVGLAVSWKRPENPMGWLFLTIGFGDVASIFASEYAGRAVYVGWEYPAVELIAWIGSWTWVVANGLLLTFAVLLFPDGQLPGPRWRPVAWIAAVVIGLTVLASAFDPNTFDTYAGMLAHPLDVNGLLGEVATAVAGVIGLVGILAMGVLSISSLMIRFRRARGTERQQLKGLLYPVGLFLVGLTAALFTQNDGVWTFALAALAAIPVGAGISILRFRLFDIDVVINRTLVYASLSLVLGGTYVGLVLALQTLLSPITQNNGPAVAVSTLAVAALFVPVRRRLQSFVDRRFYRA